MSVSLLLRTPAAGDGVARLPLIRAQRWEDLISQQFHRACAKLSTGNARHVNFVSGTVLKERTNREVPHPDSLDEIARCGGGLEGKGRRRRQAGARAARSVSKCNWADVTNKGTGALLRMEDVQRNTLLLSRYRIFLFSPKKQDILGVQRKVPGLRNFAMEA